MADEMDNSEDEMARAMAEMQEGENGPLSQEEIDSLLGFDSTFGQEAVGIEALLDKSLQSYERLPMLEVVFDRFVRTLSTSLRNFTSDNVDVNIDSITSMRFEDYLNSIPLPALLSVFQAIEWENYGIITIDSALTYSIVDILLGGGRHYRPVKIEGRPFTTIEQEIISSLTSIMLEDMSSAFNPLTPATFRLERLETNPRFATITRPANAVILISLRVEMEERGGKAEVLFPYATLDPIKDLLTQMFTGESFGSDASWESHLSSEVKSTTVNIEAALKTRQISLKELAELKVGSTIIMEEAPDDIIDVRCKGVKLLAGKIGRSNNKMAIRIKDVYNKNIRDLV